MKKNTPVSLPLRILLVHLGLMALMGFVTIATLLKEPSQSGGFLGFSLGRWAILFANLLIVGVLLFTFFKMLKNQAGKWENWLKNEKYLFLLFYSSLFLFAFSLPAALGKIPALRYFTYFGRIQPSLNWLAFSSGMTSLTLLVVLRHSIYRWARQFFPQRKPAQEKTNFTKSQRLLILGILALYLSLQIVSFLQVREAKWLPDSIDYIFPAETYAWNNPGLWTHTKPWGTAIFYKLIGTSPLTIDLIQTLLSTFAWLSLAWIFSRIARDRRLRIASFAFILGFSLSPPIQMWNHIIQSESLSLSLMVLIIAVWLSLLEKWQWKSFILLTLLFAWWIGTRESNLYLSLLIAAILILVGAFYKKQRFYWLFAILLILFSYKNMQISKTLTMPRWYYPLTNIVLNRILPDEEFLGFFEETGMPVSPELLSLSGGFAHSGDFAIFNSAALNDVESWLYEKGKMVYLHFLIAHPIYTLTSPWENSKKMLTPDNIPEYAPEQYQPPLGWLFGNFFYPDSLWLLLLLALLTLVTAIKVFPLLNIPVTWLLLTSLTLFFPHFYLVWHGDALEVGRHAVQVSVQLRLSLWLLLFVALDKLKLKKHAI